MATEHRKPRELVLAHLLVVVEEHVESDQYRVTVWNAGTFVADTWRRLPVPDDARLIEVAKSALTTAGQTVPKDVPDLAVRYADNVLDETDWPVRHLWFTPEVTSVVRVLDAQQGVYSFSHPFSPQVGWTLDQVVEWAAYDSTDRHPEEYHEVAVPGAYSPAGLRWNEPGLTVAMLRDGILTARKARAEKGA